MPLFICYFCKNELDIPGRKFEAAKPVCPKCGADQKNPRHASRVVNLETIHFHPPSAHEHIGTGSLACTPGEEFPNRKGAAKHGTGEPHLVNCPACRKTEVFQKELPNFPEPAVVDGEDFTIRPVTEKEE